MWWRDRRVSRPRTSSKFPEAASPFSEIFFHLRHWPKKRRRWASRLKLQSRQEDGYRMDRVVERGDASNFGLALIALLFASPFSGLRSGAAGPAVFVLSR